MGDKYLKIALKASRAYSWTIKMMNKQESLEN